MRVKPFVQKIAACFLLILLASSCFGDEEPALLQISGIYPHLAAFNQPADEDARANHKEAGIGAVVPWAGKLWYITYPPHMRQGSNDKLHEIDKDLQLTIREESVGGTHANRFIHRPSNQLIIGPYFIDVDGNVRAVDVEQLVGRMTATAEHLTDPENKVLFYDMEGRVYEVDVHTLDVNLLYEKPVPGWHGKGAYTGQGHFIVANNGEHISSSVGYENLVVGGPAKNIEEAGVLAEWDGEDWRIIERKKFTDVTGPGGLNGSPGKNAPIWTMGWDKQSVLLKVRDTGRWSTYRLPKGSHTFDPRHGWYTEWPRIRQIGGGRYMMVMHGSMFNFPSTFSSENTAGIQPIATHLRYIPDFTYWNGRVVLAADDASFLQNPMVGQAQSNLWFGSHRTLNSFGPKHGWGGPWVQDAVVAGQPSDPFLVRGYQNRVVHLSHESEQAVTFTLEVDVLGDGIWTVLDTVQVAARGYTYKILSEDLEAEWIRLKVDQSATVTAYFHFTGPRWTVTGETFLFDGLASAGAKDGLYTPAIMRPAGHNRSLQLVTLDTSSDYYEVSLSDDAFSLSFDKLTSTHRDEVLDLAGLPEKPIFEVDTTSVIVFGQNGERFRLPKGDNAFDRPMSFGWPRSLREAVSERFLANIHGTFYEIPRVLGTGAHYPDYQKIKPVSSHNKIIADFCTWRGLFVMSGVLHDATEDGQVFKDVNAGNKGTGLWFGMIDDLWKLGSPTGSGGPWFESNVLAGETSDPFLMTGFNEKSVTLSHNSPESVSFTIEVAINHFEWKTYATLEVPAGESLTHEFPEGYQAHWARLTTNAATQASATFTYK
ncbi:MAG: hypothetical protein AB8G77_16075 [Rhodothermales bacterium]